MTGCYVNLFTDFGDLNGDVDLHVVSEFVCRVYAATNTRDVNEARYQKLVKMTGKVDQVITRRIVIEDHNRQNNGVLQKYIRLQKNINRD